MSLLIKVYGLNKVIVNNVHNNILIGYLDIIKIKLINVIILLEQVLCMLLLLGLFRLGILLLGRNMGI